jgi:hypothetical protein
MNKHLSVKHSIFVIIVVVGIIFGLSAPFSVAQATHYAEDQASVNQQEEADCNAVAYSSSSVNQLRGPDTRFGTYRVLYSGHHVEIGGKFISPVDDALWWLIGDGSWIPSDAVAADGDCENVRLYTFEELFGLGINFDTGIIEECIGSTEDDVEQHESPSGASPAVNTAVDLTAVTPMLNFAINAQLVLTESELSWWLVDSGLWIPTTALSVVGPCETVPLLRPDDLEMLDVDPTTGGVRVCMVMAEGFVPLYDEPMGESNTPFAFETALLTNTFWAETVIAKYTEATGAVWWQLASGKWVNGADVIIHGACRRLPESNPDAETATICFIHSEVRGTRVRVGPGINRGIFTALPPNQDFAVWGQHTSGDGLLWWQIDDTTLDPSDLAESLWVADSAVIAEGDCADVPPTDGPQITVNTNPSGGNGQWGACGSCNSCGYPESECVTSPTGQCLWDPTTCRGISAGGGGTGTSGCYALGAQANDLRGIGASIVVRTQTNCTYPLRAGTGAGYTPGTIITAIIVAPTTFGVTWSGCGTSGNANPITFTMNGTCVLLGTVN